MSSIAYRAVRRGRLRRVRRGRRVLQPPGGGFIYTYDYIYIYI